MKVSLSSGVICSTSVTITQLAFKVESCPPSMLILSSRTHRFDWRPIRMDQETIDSWLLLILDFSRRLILLHHYVWRSKGSARAWGQVFADCSTLIKHGATIIRFHLYTLSVIITQFIFVVGLFLPTSLRGLHKCFLGWDGRQ